MKRNVSLATAREQVAYLANQRQLKAQARQVVDGGGGFSAIPYDVWTGMDRAGKEALAAYAMAGGQVTTDAVAFYRLRDLALDHPQDFLDTDLNDHIHQVDAKDLASLTALQATLRDKGADDPEVNLLRSYKANTDRVLRQLGVLPAAATSEDVTAGTAEGKAASDSTPSAAAGDDGLQARIAATFRRDVDIAVSAQESAAGRKATPAEQQQIVDQVAINLRRIQAQYDAQPSRAVYSEMGAQAGDDNPLLVRTAGGDVQMADATNGEGEQTSQGENASQNGTPNILRYLKGLERLRAGPEPLYDRMHDEGAQEQATWHLPYPNENFEPSYKGEMKAMGGNAREAEAAIRNLRRAKYWPIDGDHTLNKPDFESQQGDGRFGMMRNDNTKEHQGIDITAKEGTPVVAVNDGEVVWVVNNVQGRGKGGFGNEVVIKHADGTYTQYAHLNPAVDARGNLIKEADGKARIILKVGDKVKAGQQIAETGKTGNAAGSKDAHLHFEVRYGTAGLRKGPTRTIINPMYYLPID